MEILTNLKKWIIQWIWIILVLILSWATYAAWSLLPTEIDWQTLTAAKWNAVIDRLNLINEKSLATAWVNFDWTNCPSNVCTINGSYNISSITKIAVWQYIVIFSTPMNNINYSAVAAMSLTASSSEHPYVKDYTINSVTIILAHTAFIDQSKISLQVFWWK